MFGAGRAVAWNGNLWAATGVNSNSIATSSNGIDWTGQGTAMSTGGCFGITWNGSLWVAVGASGTSGTIVTSSDGITWTPTGALGVPNIFSSRGNAIASRRVLPFVGTRTTGGLLFDTSGAQLANGIFRNQPGTVSAPSYTFVNDVSMGLYDPATNVIGFTTAGVERMRITADGVVGINTATPSNALFHVNGSTTNTQGPGTYFDTTATAIQNFGSASRNISIYGSSVIWANAAFISTSDQRIKNNICDISDSSALDTIRLIQPKRYGYVDTVARGGRNVFGFIAQQIESTIPDAITTGAEFIPNMYDRCQCTPGITTHVTLETKDVSFIPQTDPSGNEIPTRIKFYDTADKEVIGTLHTILGTREFTIHETLPETDYFAYGQEVNDFKTLNKDAIFTVATAALQEVDRQLQVEKAKTAELQTQVTELFNRVSRLEAQGSS
jgi:hypothetical protein